MAQPEQGYDNNDINLSPDSALSMNLFISGRPYSSQAVTPLNFLTRSPAPVFNTHATLDAARKRGQTQQTPDSNALGTPTFAFGPPLMDPVSLQRWQHLGEASLVELESVEQRTLDGTVTHQQSTDYSSQQLAAARADFQQHLGEVDLRENPAFQLPQAQGTEPCNETLQDYEMQLLLLERFYNKQEQLARDKRKEAAHQKADE